MSTPTGPIPGIPSSPGTPSQPASSWFPNLANLGLPRALTSGVQQSFSLVYSLRDQVNALQATVEKLLQYGTNHDRLQVNAQAMPDGALYFETDTKTIWQARMNPKSNSREWVAV
jgi:hypothetical protein